MKAKPLVAGTLVLAMSVNASADIFRFFKRPKAAAAVSCQTLLIGAAPLSKRTITPRVEKLPTREKTEKPVVEKAVSVAKSFNKNPSLEEASQSLLNYRETVMGQILERDYVLKPFLWALIAKEHVLLIGPPGNAKTTLAKILLSNIVDESTGQSVFYSMQMNKEITLSDTHGSINYKTMSDKGVVERNYTEGILGAKMAFIDESFDIRPGALRNLLDVLAERGHSQGTKQHKGLTEVVVAATNKTLPEVYEEHNNSEGPRALVDRFAQIIFIPKEMENIKADRAIFRGERAQAKPIHQITFAELDMIRSLVPKVTIPDHVADLAAIIHYRLAPELEAREVKSAEQYREKIQNGEHTLPPFRASKYMSPRTLGKAGNILKAIVVEDYVAKNGDRPLTATTEDLAKLRSFYQMGGPNEVFLDKQLSRSLKEHEKEQIKSVKVEREVVDRVFDENLKEFNESLANFNLQELDRMAKDYKVLSKPDRNKLMDMFKLVYQQGLESYKLTDKEEITPTMIASAATLDLIKSYIHDLKPAQATKILALWEKDMTKVEKQRYVSAKKMRKQLYRYGYDKKGEAGVAKNVRGKMNGKVQFEQIRFHDNAESGTSRPEDFDFIGDEMLFIPHGAAPTITVDGGTQTKAGWGAQKFTVKTISPISTILTYPGDSTMYELRSDGSYDRHTGPGGTVLGGAKSQTEPNTYYIWGTQGITRVSIENDVVRDTRNIYSWSVNNLDFNVVSKRIVEAENYEIREVVPDPNNASEFTKQRAISTDYLGFGERDRIWSLSDDITLLTRIDYGEGVSVANFADGTLQVIESLNQTTFTGITMSSDRRLTALVYTDRLDIYDTAVLADRLSKSLEVGEPLQRVTAPDVGDFVNARFDDNSSRIAVKTEQGFVIFQNRKASGK